MESQILLYRPFHQGLHRFDSRILDPLLEGSYVANTTPLPSHDDLFECCKIQKPSPAAIGRAEVFIRLFEKEEQQ